jgi:hydroxyacylglutathione hydrolase
MMQIPIEDFAADVISKAMRGLGLSANQLAEKSHLSEAAIERLTDETAPFDADAARAVAPVLGLGADALVSLGQMAWTPQEIHLDGIAQVNTTFDDMTVNAYLLWDPASGKAAAFDSGANASPLLQIIEDNGLSLQAVFLTHTHADHVADLEPLLALADGPLWCSSHEPWDGAELFDPGRTFELGALRIQTRLTRGHSPGATTYVVSGLARPLAIVGDALFSCSMGGPKISYEDCLETNRLAIFTLPDDTVLCPGHGPMTTVAEERRQNPFFSA